MDKIVEFFRAATTQFNNLRRNGYSSFLTSRKTQTQWLLGICAVAGFIMLSMLSSLSAQRHRWTTSQPVVVATVDLSAGTSLSSANTEIVSIPAALVSADALTSLPDNGITRIALRARTPLTSSVVATSDDIAQIPEGWRIVALPRSMPAPPLQVGDAVDIVGGTVIVAQGALVTSLEPLTVGVPADVVATVATAARLGEISLVVSR